MKRKIRTRMHFAPKKQTAMTICYLNTKISIWKTPNCKYETNKFEDIMFKLSKRICWVHLYNTLHYTIALTNPHTWTIFFISLLCYVSAYHPRQHGNMKAWTTTQLWRRWINWYRFSVLRSNVVAPLWSPSNQYSVDPRKYRTKSLCQSIPN